MLTLGGAIFAECPSLVSMTKSLEQKPYVELTFSQLVKSEIFGTTDTLPGKVWAGPGGLFRIETDDETIVSNGIVEWDYSVSNEQVLVDSIETEDDWDPVSIINDPLRIYDCLKETKEGGNIVCYLEARDSLTEPRSFKLWLDSKRLTPIKLSYNDQNDSEIKISIDDYRQLSELPDSAFLYTPPDGVEVIYMP